MIGRDELRAELRRLAGDEELPDPARRAIAAVVRELERRKRGGLPVPADDDLRALVLAGRDVARGLGSLADVGATALLALASLDPAGARVTPG